jgi:hypothetical protein
MSRGLQRAGAPRSFGALAAAMTLALGACNDTPPEPTRRAPASIAASATNSVAAASASIAAESPAPSASAAAAPPTAMPPSTQGVLGDGVADQIIARGAAPFVRVLSPGEEPRAVLEYAPAEERTVVIGMRLDLEVQVTEGLKPSVMRPPTVGMNLSVRAGMRGPAGVPIHGSIGKASLLGPLPNAEAKKKLERAVRQLDGMTIDYSLGADGTMSDVKVATKDDDGSAAELIDQVRESFSSLVAPLPRQPVGVGATWQAVSPVDAGVDTLHYAT